MNDTCRRTTAPKAEARGADNRHCYYLVSEEQSADLSEFRYAMRGLASIAGDVGNAEDSAATIERQEFNAVFAQLEKRLREILPPERLGAVWLDPEARRSAFARARALEPDAAAPRD